ncbi:MAG: hypothetical protein UR42_C0020G0004 [Candidatus Roizmanbacteria bacterium GW2011_GWA2_33_33]|uniref:Uncharacterized protein n=2 Tax=Candidatus Roizmaniibacteriota TaxID=1752723 RepID=A0A0G0E5Z0_9BACT|nr:MAG: hypothetical protein UR42_C0020G0004 [Candidatus Roizmanbacteria bacterium GW2011_GWA2_33_33]KKP62757.1 MAG: hypothetical protein UR56_C0005G0003 [Candidatus Roizmanbacteria bacterium GW2011_GWC2_34_23]
MVDMDRPVIENGLSLKELGSTMIVTLACAYLALAHILLNANAYITANISPEISLWYRLGAAAVTALASSVAGGSAAWVTRRRKK